MILKKAVATALVGSMLFIGTACTKNSPDSDVKVKVNDTVITVEQYDKAYNDYKAMYEEKYGEDIWKTEVEEDKTFEEYLEDTVLETLILEVILLEEAEKENIDATQEEIDKELKAYTDVFGDDDKFNEFLKSNNISEEFLVESIKKELIITKFLNEKTAYINNMEPTDEQLLDIFNKKKDAFVQIRASHILLKTEDDANEAMKKLQSGANFEELAKEISICPSSKDGGDLGYFYFDEMAYEFSEVAFNMKVGELSGIVKTDYGYHIIKLTDKKADFEDADKEKLIYQFRANEYNNFLDKYIKNAKIEK